MRLSPCFFGRGAPVLFAAWLLGCSGPAEAPADEPPGGTTACVAGELTGESGCVPAGLPPDLACPPGELASDVGCRAAGVAPEECGEGFSPDGARGCMAVIPESCPEGQIAVPGDESCRPVAPCPTGMWGSIPVEPTTQHVDLSYAGAAPSDGSAAAPWKTIQDGIDHAAEGAIVAIASGTYFEDLVLGAPVVLWGVCPEKVSVSGSTLATAAVQVTGGDGAEIRDMAITGGSHALLVNSASALVDRVWIHDAPGLGAVVQDTFGPARLDLQRSLIEHVGGASALSIGSELFVVDSAFRDGVPGFAGLGGAGLYAQIDPKTDRRAVMGVTGSVVEDNRDMGIAAAGADVTVDRTLVRRMRAGVMNYGRAVHVGIEPQTMARGTMTLERSVLTDGVEAGLVVEGADAIVRNSTVRGVEDNNSYARGIGGISHPETGRCNLTVSGSLVERAAETALTVTGCDALIEGTLVRGAVPAVAPVWGWGIHIEGDSLTGQRSLATVVGCVVEGAVEVGVDVFAADATIEATVVRDVVPGQYAGAGVAIGGTETARGTATVRAVSVERAFGGMMVQLGDAVLEQSRIVDCQRGVNVQMASTATARGLTIERSSELGVFVSSGAQVTLDALSILETSFNAEGRFGDGVAVLGGTTGLSISRTRIEGSQRAAILNAGASVSFGESAFLCSGFDLEGEDWNGSAYRYEHTGGAVCGCGDEVSDCQILSGGMEPPPELTAPTR